MIQFFSHDNPHTPVKFSIKAFDVNALDYILKPVNPDRLAEAITKVGKKFTQASSTSEKLTINKRIFIKDGEQCFFVPLSEVYFIESAGNYARVYYQDKKPLLHKSLNYLEDKLPEEFFFSSTNVQYLVCEEYHSLFQQYIAGRVTGRHEGRH